MYLIFDTETTGLPKTSMLRFRIQKTGQEWFRLHGRCMMMMVI